MIVRNIVGGGGLRSANQAWISKPNGYEIVQIKTGAYILSGILYPKQVKFKMKEWQYLGQYTRNTNVLVLRTEIWEKIKTYQDLVNYAKKKPLVSGTGGVGSSMHNTALLFSQASKIPLRYVHYDGAVQVRAAMIRGEVDLAIGLIAPYMQMDPKDTRISFIFNDSKGQYTSAAPSALDFGFPENVLQKINSNPVFQASRALAVHPETPVNVVKILRDSFWKLVTSQEFDQAFKDMNDVLIPIKAEQYEKDLPTMISTVEKFVPILKKHIK